MDMETLYKAIESIGYSYDQCKDIFYSNLKAWQRNCGYCHLYDEAAAPLGMIIDCEPIYFQYDEKQWLIEFWKGQYDLATGAEIGIYTPEGPELIVNGVSKGMLYKCASEENQLDMSFVLKKNGKELFTREENHWWLTGFRLGEFSNPSQLTLDLKITLKDTLMCNAFVAGLKKAGYLENEIKINEKTVSLEFNKPHTHQPITRLPETDLIMQINNKIMCGRYQKITSPYNTFPEKINAIEKQAPDLLEKVLKIGKSKELFEIFMFIEFYVY